MHICQISGTDPLVGAMALSGYFLHRCIETDLRSCLQEEIGIETDEDVGYNITDFSNLGVKKQKNGF
jgi:hypothetical protein